MGFCFRRVPLQGCNLVRSSVQASRLYISRRQEPRLQRYSHSGGSRLPQRRHRIPRYVAGLCCLVVQSPVLSTQKWEIVYRNAELVILWGERSYRSAGWGCCVSTSAQSWVAFWYCICHEYHEAVNVFPWREFAFLESGWMPRSYDFYSVQPANARIHLTKLPAEQLPHEIG